MNLNVGVATPEWLPIDPSVIPGDPGITVSVLVLALIAMSAGVRSLIRYLRVRTPATPLLSLSTDGGAVEVSGTAYPRDGAVLRSPFTDTACLVSRSRVEGYYPSVLGDADSFGLDELLLSDEWRMKHDETASTPFYVDDGSARLLVDPDGATLRLSTHETTLKIGDPIPDPIREFLESAHARGDAPWAKRLLQGRDRSRVDKLATEFELAGPTEWRFVEERLDVESPVHVLGPVSPRRTTADEVGVVHALVGRSPRPMTDGSGDTRVSRRSRTPFVIADESEAELERDLRLSMAFEFGAGVLLLGLLALYVLGYLPL